MSDPDGQRLAGTYPGSIIGNARDGRKSRGRPTGQADSAGTARPVGRVRRGGFCDPPARMRICLVYDCLFPWTVGGAERWMRNLAETLAAAGHEVTYLTRLQWDPEGDDVPDLPGVTRDRGQPLRAALRARRQPHDRRAAAVRRRGPQTPDAPRRRLRRRPHRVVPLLQPARGRRWRRRRHRKRFGIVADWHEVWSDDYWAEYLGGPKGVVAREIQKACARVPQDAFCFSELHAQRLREIGLRGAPTVLRGEYIGALDRPDPVPVDPVRSQVVFAGRLIPEKQAPALVPAIALAAARVEGLHRRHLR